MYTQESLLDLVDLIYAAAYEPRRWTEVLEVLQRLIGAAGADVCFFDFKESSFNFSHSVGLVNATFTHEYLANFIGCDPWVLAVQANRLFRTGTVGIGDALVSTSELKKTRFYNDFARHWDYTGGLTAVISGDGVRGSALSLCRAKDRVFGEPEERLMRALMPHLQRAVQVHQRLAHADSLASASLSSLELSKSAIFLVDARGRLRHATASAAALLRRRDGVMDSGGELHASHTAESKVLRKAIADAIDTSTGNGRGSGGRLTLSRESGGRPLQVVVSPVVVQAALLAETSVAAAVLITDPDCPAVVSERDVARALGLTPAEARLARALVEGLTIAEAAERLETTQGTLRTRLKGIFVKTDTHRQAELVRLVAGLQA